MDMDKLLAAVVVAAISALTFVAYRHPASYRKIYAGISIGATIVLGEAVLWDMSNDRACIALLPYFDSAKLGAALKASDDRHLLSGLIFFGFFVLMGYLALLQLLPWMLEEKKPKR